MKRALKANYERAARLLRERDNFHIICHVNPDGDAVGTACALNGMLASMGKKASVVCASPIPESFEFVTGRFENTCEEAETVISVDTASAEQWGGLWEKYGRCDLAIDHHVSHTPIDALSVVDASSASASIMLFPLAECLQIALTADMADAIFLGLTTDTGCFKYANTDERAHNAAAECIRLGADSLDINRRMFETKTRAEIEMWRMILNSIEYRLDGRIAMTTVTQTMRRQSGFYNDDLGELASIPRQIKGVECGITLKQLRRGVYKISIRTNGDLDAQKIAKFFGGGGHKNASGCTIRGAVGEVKKALVAKAEELLNENR